MGGAWHRMPGSDAESKVDKGHGVPSDSEAGETNREKGVAAKEAPSK
jgi:hypothetical protein